MAEKSKRGHLYSRKKTGDKRVTALLSPSVRSNLPSASSLVLAPAAGCTSKRSRAASRAHEEGVPNNSCLKGTRSEDANQWSEEEKKVQYCFTSTETVGTVSDREPRTATATFTMLLYVHRDSTDYQGWGHQPGRPPRLSRSSWALCVCVGGGGVERIKKQSANMSICMLPFRLFCQQYSYETSTVLLLSSVLLLRF